MSGVLEFDTRWLDVIKESYNDLNSHLDWKSVIKYGGLALGGYFVYSFGVKPFLSPLRKVPGPGYGPIFGNVREAMVGEAMQSSIGWVKEYGGVVRFYHLLGRERLLVADPMALKHIMVTNVENYERIIAQGFIGSGIFNVTGEEHKIQRRLMNPFFHFESIKNYRNVFESCVSDLKEYWSSQLSAEKPVEINVQDDVMRMTLDAIGRTVFGYEFCCLRDPQSKINTAFRVVTGQSNISFTRLIPCYDKLPTKANKELWKSTKLIDDIIYDIISHKRRLLETENGRNEATQDLLGKLMMAKDEDTGKGFSDNELRDQVLSLLIAGHETTGATMSWLLLLLAQHQDIQDKIRSELKQCISSDDLSACKYFNAFIKEGQRLYPAAPSFYRRVKKDDEINGYFIPAGTIIAYHVGALMRNPSIWEDPEECKPERFLDHPADTTYTHLPFITGSHKCLGHQFAKTQMLTVLSSLLKVFKFQPVPGLNVKRKLRVTLKGYPSIRLLLSEV